MTTMVAVTTCWTNNTWCVVILTIQSYLLYIHNFVHFPITTYHLPFELEEIREEIHIWPRKST